MSIKSIFEDKIHLQEPQNNAWALNQFRSIKSIHNYLTNLGASIKSMIIKSI